MRITPVRYAPCLKIKRQLILKLSTGAEQGLSPWRDKMANSFFRNALTRVIEARERQVSRYVNGALLSLDEKTLEGLGTSRAELRRKGATPYIF
jgi:hypothetical protein